MLTMSCNQMSLETISNMLEHQRAGVCDDNAVSTLLMVPAASESQCRYVHHRVVSPRPFRVLVNILVFVKKYTSGLELPTSLLVRILVEIRVD